MGKFDDYSETRQNLGIFDNYIKMDQYNLHFLESSEKTLNREQTTIKVIDI